MRLAVGSLTVLVALARAPAAFAQTAEDQASARALFDEGRELMKTGHYEDACPKLDAASKLYPGSGVLLNLGDCYEHVGRTASAWNEFAEAASAAARAGRSADQAEAERRKAAVEPKVSRIAVRVKSDAAGLVVKRDGTALDPAAYGDAVPVDPGKHEITAEAPGREPWSGQVDLEELGKTVTVEVPELDVAPASVQGQAQAPSSQTSAVVPAGPVEHPMPLQTPGYWTARRAIGVSLAGAGAVGLGVGAALGLVARSQFDRASGEQDASSRSADSKTAVSTGNVGTVVGIVGAVVGVGGLVLWLTAPSARVQVGATAGAAVLRGSF